MHDTVNLHLNSADAGETWTLVLQVHRPRHSMSYTGLNRPIADTRPSTIRQVADEMLAEIGWTTDCITTLSQTPPGQQVATVEITAGRVTAIHPRA